MKDYTSEDRAQRERLERNSPCGSPYHETKWEAEEIVRNSGLDYTVLKAGARTCADANQISWQEDRQT